MMDERNLFIRKRRADDDDDDDSFFSFFTSIYFPLFLFAWLRDNITAGWRKNEQLIISSGGRWGKKREMRSRDVIFDVVNWWTMNDFHIGVI